MSTPQQRRAFLRDLTVGGLSLAALGFTRREAAALVAPAGPSGRPPTQLRVRGRVTDARTGKGLRDVAVTDGLAVVATDADGRYTLVTDDRRGHVAVSVPAGYAFRTTAGGITRCYEPVAPDAAGEATASFALTPLGTSDAHHRFLLLADPQTANAEEMARMQNESVPDIRGTLGSGGDPLAFGIACGDIVFDNKTLYPDYERAVARMGIPFVQVAGNHDLDYSARTAHGATATFRSRYGPEYWSFDRGAVHYVVVHDVFWHGAGYLGFVGDDQLAWLAADLARVERGRTVVVFLHIPALSTLAQREGAKEPNTSDSVTNRDALYALLAPYKAHVLSGHTHEQEHVIAGNRSEHVHGAVCGAWWSGDICYDGTPNGYGVYDVRGEEVRWRYKATGRAATEQMTLYAPGTLADAPGVVLANVWDWEPAWRVVWYEDGAPRGAMTQQAGRDPRAVKEETGPDLPAGRGWIDPVTTRHLFRAAPSAGAREVRVEATDRWGTTYTSALRLRSA